MHSNLVLSARTRTGVIPIKPRGEDRLHIYSRRLIVSWMFVLGANRHETRLDASVDNVANNRQQLSTAC